MPAFLDHADWDDPGRGRVLVEAVEWHEREALRVILDRAGYTTGLCPGAEGADGRCPLAADRGCPAAAEADIVIHALRPTDLRNVEILRAMRSEHPDTPMIVILPEPSLRPEHVDDEGIIPLHPPLTNEALLETVARAILR